MELISEAEDSTELISGVNISLDEDIDYENLANLFTNLEAETLRANIKSKIARELSRFPQSIDLLYTSLLNETNMLVRKSIVTSLFIIGGEEVVRLLVPLLESQDANLRNNVLETLRSLPEYMEKYIKLLLGHNDETLRLIGVDFLALYSSDLVGDLLLDLLKKENNFNVCIAAVEKLISIEGANYFEIFDELTKRFPSEPFLKFVIDTAIDTKKISSK
jgi:HEAT repeat protein